MAGARAVIAATILLGATLTGCSEEDPVPRVGPSPSAVSPSAPSNNSSTSPSADRMTPEETVRAWVDAQNEAMRTGRLGTIRGLSSEECVTCDQFIEPVAKVYRAGGHFDTAGWTVRGTHQRRSSGTHRVVDAAVVFAGGTTVRRDGAQPVAYERENHLLVFQLARNGEGWLVAFVGFMS